MNALRRISFLLLMLMMTGCAAATIPVFDTSDIAAQARASAEVVLAETQISLAATQTAIASQPSDTDILQDADAANGEILFTTFQLEAGDSGWACSTCHFSDTENRLIGPGLLNISERATIRVEGQSAYEYVYTAITNPDAYIVETFTDDLMPENWAEIYTDEEIKDIIAYLWTLNN